jgi:hypothetical protein
MRLRFPPHHLLLNSLHCREESLQVHAVAELTTVSFDNKWNRIVSFAIRCFSEESKVTSQADGLLVTSYAQFTSPNDDRGICIKRWHSDRCAEGGCYGRGCNVPWGHLHEQHYRDICTRKHTYTVVKLMWEPYVSSHITHKVCLWVSYVSREVHCNYSYKEHQGCRMVSSGLLRRMALVRTDVSEEPGASFIRVTKIGELGTTQAATSNRQLVLFLVHRFLSSWWRRRQVPPKHRFLQEPHDVRSQKAAFFLIHEISEVNCTGINRKRFTGPRFILLKIAH